MLTGQSCVSQQFQNSQLKAEVGVAREVLKEVAGANGVGLELGHVAECTCGGVV